jgi:hypothetical protein
MNHDVSGSGEHERNLLPREIAGPGGVQNQNASISLFTVAAVAHAGVGSALRWEVKGHTSGCSFTCLYTRRPCRRRAISTYCAGPQNPITITRLLWLRPRYYFLWIFISRHMLCGRKRILVSLSQPEYSESKKEEKQRQCIAFCH